MDKNTIFIVIAVGVVAIIVLYTLRDRLKTFSLKLFGQSVEATTHKPTGPPLAGAHMTDVKARTGATVRDETGQVATMTKVETEGDASVTASGPPRVPDPSKKAPPPGQ